MKKIYKYEIPIEDAPSVPMPIGAQVLSVAASGGDSLLLWALVDTEAPVEDRHLAICGTGHPVREVGAFIATVQDSPFVWHVFEAAP